MHEWANNFFLIKHFDNWENCIMTAFLFLKVLSVSTAEPYKK